MFIPAAGPSEPESPQNPPEGLLVLTFSVKASASETGTIGAVPSSRLEGAGFTDVGSVGDWFEGRTGGLFVVSAEYVRKTATAAKMESLRCAAMGRVRTAKALHAPHTRAAEDMMTAVCQCTPDWIIVEKLPASWRDDLLYQKFPTALVDGLSCSGTKSGRALM